MIEHVENMVPGVCGCALVCGGRVCARVGCVCACARVYLVVSSSLQ